ncbi:MAG: hypothetical protein HLUCCX10_04365 [Algoriphagus marincola HL-49]|uniref:Uncharacterized protein n=1 Tax=Algoriphagus marincola HL-49 TaxID=1305737 RepID=A0A0P7YJ84_9BACT|nr:MAG: hypothetical protein HLUCCX10_04365 [Algoriphagus marincola HL-49]
MNLEVHNSDASLFQLPARNKREFDKGLIAENHINQNHSNLHFQKRL